jgi:hypothetical protein
MLIYVISFVITEDYKVTILPGMSLHSLTASVSMSCKITAQKLFNCLHMWVSIVMSLFLNNAAEMYHTTTLLVLYLLTTTSLDFQQTGGALWT